MRTAMAPRLAIRTHLNMVDSLCFDGQVVLP